MPSHSELLASTSHIAWAPRSARDVRGWALHLIENDNPIDALKFLRHVYFHTSFATRKPTVKAMILRIVWERILAFYSDHFTSLLREELAFTCDAGVHTQLHETANIAEEAMVLATHEVEEIAWNLMNLGRLNGFMEYLYDPETELCEEALEYIIGKFGE